MDPLTARIVSILRALTTISDMTTDITAEMIRQAVERYNGRFGPSEARLFELARAARQCLVGQECEDVVVQFAAEVKVWGRIQGVASTDYPKAAEALTDLPWRDLLTLVPEFNYRRAREVADLNDKVVRGIKRRGAPRHEYSWSSKMLHWLWSEQVPINDDNVRAWFGIEDQGHGPYRRLTSAVFEVAERLAPSTQEIVGAVEPKTILRAIDKTIWILVDEGWQV